MGPYECGDRYIGARQEHGDGAGRTGRHMTVDAVVINLQIFLARQFADHARLVLIPGVTAQAALRKNRESASLVAMRIVTGAAGHGFTPQEAFTGSQQPVLVSVQIYTRRVGGDAVNMEKMREGIPGAETKGGRSFLQPAPMTKCTRVQLLLAAHTGGVKDIGRLPGGGVRLLKANMGSTGAMTFFTVDSIDDALLSE